MNQCLWEKFWDWLADHTDVSDESYMKRGSFHVGGWLADKMLEWRDLLNTLDICEDTYGD